MESGIKAEANTKLNTKEMRKILHIDMDAFYASVEQRDNPALRGKPVAVGGRPDSRGVVAACSYEARAFGVHSAMPSSRAAKLCPEIIFVDHRFDAYREASQQIHSIFRQFTDEIEPLSLDEAYLDVTRSATKFGSATDIARLIKQEIKSKIKLTASAGVSYNKFLAKIASDMDKPDGLYVIRPEVAQAFIEQLEIRKFYGIGKVTEKKMQRLGIYTGKDLKKLSLIQLQTQFGSSGEYYFNIARGVDNRPVRTSSVRKSIGKETTYAENVVNKRRIWNTLKGIAERLSELLIKRELCARTVTLKIKYADFQLNTRSQTYKSRKQSYQELLDTLPELLKRTEVGVRPIRLIGITLSNFVDQLHQSDDSIMHQDSQDPPQLGLFPPSSLSHSDDQNVK